MLFIITVRNLASDFKSTRLNCAPAPQPRSSTQFSPKSERKVAVSDIIEGGGQEMEAIVKVSNAIRMN